MRVTALRQTLKAWLQHNPKAKDNSLRAYAQRVLLAFEAPVGMSKIDGATQDLPEPLSRARAGSVAVGGRGVDQPADRCAAGHFDPYCQETCGKYP